MQMRRLIASAGQSIASSKYPGVPPPTPLSRKNSRTLTPASIALAVAARATLAIRAVALMLFLGTALPLAAQDTKAPTVPNGLRGTALSATRVSLTWTAATDNVGVKGYQVFLNDAVIGTTAGTSYQLTGLAAGTTYHYRVNAFDAANNYSGWTVTPVAVKTLAAAPDTQPPSVPTGLKGTAASSTQINLTWNASTDNVGVKGYYVYLGNEPLAITTKTSFQHTGRTSGTTYNYRVSAYDAVPNHSAWTALVAVKTTGTAPPDTTPPSVPSGLAGTVVSNTQINLSWTAATDSVGVKGYQVFVNDKVISTTTATSFQHTGLAAGTTYNYRVNAFDAANNFSGWTPTPVAVKTPMVAPLDTTPPSIPSGLTGKAVSSTQINLTWTAATDSVGVKGYQVFFNDAVIGTTAGTSYQLTGLSANTTYKFRVNAFDAANNFSGWTDTPVAVTTTGTTPAAGIQWSCSFPNAPADCGFEEQGKVPGRASLVNFGRDGGTALRLHTEPGDNNVASSQTMERNDVWLTQAASNGYEGQEAWWAHSILFPDDFSMPTWQMYVVADFHNSGSGPWQANINLDFEPQADITKPGNLTLRGYGGVNSGDGAYTATIGQVSKNVWYDFVYHVRWSSGSDGYFDAWVNGVKVASHRGPTLYAGQGVYLKLANYHTPVCDPYPACVGTQPASSVIHDRVIRGATALSVSSGPLEGVLVLTNGVLTALAP
jgi:chitodextrinase